MNQLDYLSENALISYPFKDGAFLHWSYSGSGYVFDSVVPILPDTVVLDVLLNLIDTSVLSSSHSLSLVSIATDLTNWTFQFSGIVNGTVIATGSGVQTTYSEISSNPFQLVVDLDALQGYFNDNSLPSGAYTFDNPIPICINCIRLQPKMVTELKMINTTSSGSSVILDLNGSGTLTVQEGSNIQFTEPTNALIIDVAAGAGSGLYDDCAALADEVLSVNTVTADANGNLALTTDGCWVTTPATHGLVFTNNCDPSCDSPDILNFAHYLNRMLNRDAELATLAEATKTNFDAMIEGYTTCQTNIGGATAPYLLAQCSTLSNKVYNFHNISCGIYSSSNVALPVTLTANYSLNTVISEYALVPNSCYTSQNNVKTTISAPPFSSSKLGLLTNRALSPNSVLFAGLVVSQPVTAKPNIGNQADDVVFEMSTTGHPYLAGYSLPINPISSNFNASYLYSSNGTTITVALEIDLMNQGQSSTACNLNINAPGYFRVESSLLTLNEGTPVNLGLNSGFVGQTIDFSKANRYNLVLSTPIANNESFTITMNFITGLGNANKSFTITP